ncbi:TPA_asm: DUF3310 domain-containing protein [Listeria monocytogenes]|nr:DUF3310 domain-containing protein [Listeria monocytogenes]
MSSFKKGDHLVPKKDSGLEQKVVIFKEYTEAYGLGNVFEDTCEVTHSGSSWEKLLFRKGERLINIDDDGAILEECIFDRYCIADVFDRYDIYDEHFLDNNGYCRKTNDWVHDPYFEVNLEPDEGEDDDDDDVIGEDGNDIAPHNIKTEVTTWEHTPIDNINNPTHYTQGNIECIDYIYDKKLNFALGSAIKYITRAGHKEGSTKEQDLKKAIKFLEFELEKGED